MEIISKQEAIAKGLNKFFTGEPCKRGHIAARTVSKHMCVECQKLLARRHAEANEEKLAAQKSAWYQANKEKMSEYNRAYLIRNRARINANLSRYKAENPEKVKLWALKYRQSEEGKLKRSAHWESYSTTRRGEINARNRVRYRRLVETDRGKLNHLAALRRAERERATPPWANKGEIAKIYKMAAEIGEEVDHIIPLRGKIVCGLHVETNLRIVPKSVNRKKYNKFDPDEHAIKF